MNWRSLVNRVEPWQWAVGLGAVGWLALRKSPLGGMSFSEPAEGFISPLEPEKGCDPVAKPGVVAFRSYVLSHFGGTDLGIIRACSGAGDGHMLGKAWDWGVLGGNAQIPQMLDWLFANNAEVIRRAGIMYVIYNERIWNSRDQRWSNYTGTNPHTDHVHISFGTAGAMGRTSFYSGLA